MALLTTTRIVAALAALAVCSFEQSTAQPTGRPDLLQASLEDLMKLQVTSVSKKEQDLSKAAAAIFVITQEDIRRSGAANIPDLLRMVPGVDVARVDANRWAISVRGFMDQHADKVLVLIDGRSVYSPSFSGVFWDMIDVPLEDIERIEVIRGPGGTMWGANAVNGVINILTKQASRTPGGLISAGTGSEDRGDGLVQYGGQIGQGGSYRVFGRYFNVGNSIFPGGSEAADAWQAGHAGFRSDWDIAPRDSLTVQGDFFKTDESQTVTTSFSNALPLTRTFNDPVRVTAGNALARWNHTLAGGSQMSLQLYDDYGDHVQEDFVDSQNTVDLDFQHHLALGARNDVVWGAGFRLIASDYGTGYYITILPHHRMDHVANAFLQDEIKLSPSLSLTLGSKIEHNGISGFEFEPSAQLVWSRTGRHVVWLSASRAIREPSSVDVGVVSDSPLLQLAPALFGVVQVDGNPKLKSERLRDFELGYRAVAGKRFALDVAGFADLYPNLQQLAFLPPAFISQTGIPYLLLAAQIVNGGGAHTYGAVFSGNWNVTGRWRISPGYSYFVMHYGSDSTYAFGQLGASPKHQFQVRSQLELSHRFEWDNTLEYVDKLAYGAGPAYARLDSRLGWRAGESLELSIVGQNLLSPRHMEMSDTVYPARHTLVERGVL